ncbi:MAG: hypothetical protein HFH15_11475 [Ruminococcus sp.]|nr:hypothetical protein [Ruminococcus sp.]
MKKNIQLLGTSAAVLILVCTITVQAGQETGKYESVVKTGQEIQEQKNEKGKEDAVQTGVTIDKDDDNVQTGDGRGKDGGNDFPELEKEEGEKEPLPGECEDTASGQPSVKPIESMLMPEILYPENDGKNGYYKSYPDIQIIHREAEAVTKYELITADGSKKQGSLVLEDGTEETIFLSGDFFKEGENVLWVSMERKDVQMPEKKDESEDVDRSKEMDTLEEGADKIVFSEEFHFLIDTEAPDKIQFFYQQAVDKGTIFTNQSVEITVKSEDTGSGMKAIYYQASDGTSGVIPEGNGKIVLSPGFHGRIKAYAEDKAGNQSESGTSETILCENGSPEISIQAEGGVEIWHSGPVRVHVDVSDPGLSSGIRSLKCYSAGSVIMQEEYAASAGVTGMQTDFVVDALSESGNGIPVIAEAVDWAGNYHTEYIQLYIDGTAPVIQSEGIHDKMIKGESLKGRIKFREENILAYRKMETWKINPDKTRELLNKKEGEQGVPAAMQDIGWDVSIEEDGVYEIYVEAEDLAGNKSEQRYQITIDKTDPVIRYVDQMQGVYVPYFQWNYGKEEVVQDATEYSYAIRLDGRLYNTGTRVMDEGARVLQVEAIDAAGNQSTAEAIFQIDHTPPRIRIYDVEDGLSYQEMAAISVSVDGKGEYLKGITVNSEKKRLETGCQIFRQTFQEPGDYRIKILAEDLAGNQENEQVTFRIEEQKRMAGSVWKPVTKILRNENTAADFQKDEDGNVEEEDRLAPLCLGLCLGASVLAVVFRQWWIRRERKG